MAKLYNKYGCMNSGKTLDLLRTAHAYEEQGKRILLYTSYRDNREGVGIIASRAMAEERQAQVIHPDTNMLHQILEDANKVSEPIHCVIIDESQFMTEDQVRQLLEFALTFDIPVIAYGLKNTFDNQFFEGSRALALYAQSHEEIKGVCSHPTCNRKSTMNVRIDKTGQPVYHGEQVKIGGNDTYRAVCPYHYLRYQEDEKTSAEERITRLCEREGLDKADVLTIV